MLGLNSSDQGSKVIKPILGRGPKEVDMFGDSCLGVGMKF